MLIDERSGLILDEIDDIPIEDVDAIIEEYILPDAQDAWYESKSKGSNLVTIELDHIKERIDEACKRGEFCCVIHKFLSDGMVRLLEKKGYTVIRFNEFVVNGFTFNGATRIIWKLDSEGCD